MNIIPSDSYSDYTTSMGLMVAVVVLLPIHPAQPNMVRSRGQLAYYKVRKGTGGATTLLSKEIRIYKDWITTIVKYTMPTRRLIIPHTKHRIRMA